MAGIGFELRKLLKKRSYAGLLQTYVYAGIISSGPWVLSIIGILVVGLLSISVVVPNVLISQFQVTVTYIIAISLIFTGLAQLVYTRYIADRLFENKEDLVVPTLNGLLLVILLIGGTIVGSVAYWFFPEQSILYRFLIVIGFSTLSSIWLVAILLSGLKQYMQIFWSFLLGYIVVVGSAFVLRRYGMEGLLAGFVFGHIILLMSMLFQVYRSFPESSCVSFSFFNRNEVYLSLVVSGFLFNLGLWVDKFMFWFNPDTGQQVIGPLHASVIYDFPLFLAYLAIIPGMAVFLVRIETDFAEYYDRFFRAVREGSTLEYIEVMRNEMVISVRKGIFDIAKIQTIFVLISFLLAPSFLSWLGVSLLYLPLLYIDIISASLQVALLALINILFYLDERILVMKLMILFVLTNLLFTWISFNLGVVFFGYGIAVSLTVTLFIGLWILNRLLDRLEFDTFMMHN
ncbi:MAG: exopolysaccharide Pel transporter PelG [Gammaproteobacteria bacterium]|nr:exopolysaccharide Pel transporter PelG [Gammaproteobacteria bacterium]